MRPGMIGRHQRFKPLRSPRRLEPIGYKKNLTPIQSGPKDLRLISHDKSLAPKPLTASFTPLTWYVNQILTKGRGDAPNYWDSEKAHDRGEGIGPDPRSRDEAPTPGNSRPNPSAGWRYDGPDSGSSRPTSGDSSRDSGPWDGDINGAGDW